MTDTKVHDGHEAFGDAPILPKDVWFVWTKNGNRPRFAHPSEAAALREAQRLAKRYPGNSFLVMHAVHKVRVEPAAEIAA